EEASHHAGQEVHILCQKGNISQTGNGKCLTDGNNSNTIDGLSHIVEDYLEGSKNPTFWF
ncbi:MAG TPA: hypothetical protein DCS83_08855, partial [Prevotella sp.]|nr:hypothetical protein [Prevotella sp.]